LAQNHQVNLNLLDEFPSKQLHEWPPFSKKKFKSTIVKCNNLFTSRLDHISWRYLKAVIKDNKCLTNIIKIANICINLGLWPVHFKTSLFIIISKPNKMTYDSPKIFWTIVFLNMLENFIIKVIGERLQFQVIVTNFVYPN